MKIKGILLLVAFLSLQGLMVNVSSFTRPTTTTVTVYPTCDGDIGTNSNTSYAAARTVADCVDCSTDGIISVEHSVGRINGTDYYSVIRGALNFDTSFLGPDAVIVSAVFSIKPTNIRFDFAGSDSIRLTSHSAVGGNGCYATSDFGNIGAGALAPDHAVSNLMTDQYANFNLNSAGLAAINKTGVSRFGLRSVADVAGQHPIVGTDAGFPDRGGTVVFFYSSETVGTGSDPKLTITYTSNGPAFAASIIASPQSGPPPLTVNFSITANSAVSSVIWKLNGVQFSTSATPTLLMPTVGTHRVDAIVTGGGTTVSVFTNITVACSCQ